VPALNNVMNRAIRHEMTVVVIFMKISIG